MSGIYLHIPFCKQVFLYSDSYFVTDTSERNHFVEQLIAEIESYRDSKFTQETVKTIYFGGGTPSLLEPSQIEEILEMIDAIFELQPREITFEVDPNDASQEYFSALQTVGINRISMGVQTFNPDLLDLLNCRHSQNEALQSLERLQNSDFESFNVDLRYGNPDETMDHLKEDLENILQFDPPHVSAYMLTIEPGTQLEKQVKSGEIIPLKDEKVTEQFELINSRLQQHGIERYEVSNYSKPGCEAIHNSNHWYHKNYLGFGPSAHSFWWGEKALRWGNEPDLDKYLRGNVSQNKEELNKRELAEERLLMGLRTRDGVGINELSKKYEYEFSENQQEFAKKQVEEGMMQFNNRIKLTDKGIKFADAIILDLLTLH